MWVEAQWASRGVRPARVARLEPAPGRLGGAVGTRQAFAGVPLAPELARILGVLVVDVARDEQPALAARDARVGTLVSVAAEERAPRQLTVGGQLGDEGVEVARVPYRKTGLLLAARDVVEHGHHPVAVEEVGVVRPTRHVARPVRLDPQRVAALLELVRWRELLHLLAAQADDPVQRREVVGQLRHEHVAPAAQSAPEGGHRRIREELARVRDPECVDVARGVRARRVHAVVAGARGAAAQAAPQVGPGLEPLEVRREPRHEPVGPPSRVWS